MGECTHGQNTHVSDVFTRVPGFIFAKISGNIEGKVGFMANDSVATVCSMDVAKVTDFWRVLTKIDIPVFIMYTGIPQLVGISQR